LNTSERPVNGEPDAPVRIVWGAAAIAREIDRTPRQVRHMLRCGTIESAKRKGGRWCAPIGALKREFGID